jgi:hypothetical protein
MRELHRVGFSAANRGFGHARGPRYLRVLPLHKVLQAVLIVALLAVAASAIHAPHWPEMLFGMHGSSGIAEHSMVPGPPGAAFHTAEASSAEEIWCSVEAVAPALLQVLLTLVTTGLVLAIALVAQAIGLVPSRTKPPPLFGARLRASLQVFQN